MASPHEMLTMFEALLEFEGWENRYLGELELLESLSREVAQLVDEIYQRRLTPGLLLAPPIILPTPVTSFLRQSLKKTTRSCLSLQLPFACCFIS